MAEEIKKTMESAGYQIRVNRPWILASIPICEKEPFRNIKWRKDLAGYRRSPVFIRQSKHIPPRWQIVGELMEK